MDGRRSAPRGFGGRAPVKIGTTLRGHKKSRLSATFFSDHVGILTQNLLIRSQVLYTVELRGRYQKYNATRRPLQRCTFSL